MVRKVTAVLRENATYEILATKVKQQEVFLHRGGRPQLPAGVCEDVVGEGLGLAVEEHVAAGNLEAVVLALQQLLEKDIRHEVLHNHRPMRRGADADRNDAKTFAVAGRDKPLAEELAELRNSGAEPCLETVVPAVLAPQKLAGVWVLGEQGPEGLALDRGEEKEDGLDGDRHASRVGLVPHVGILPAAVFEGVAAARKVAGLVPTVVAPLVGFDHHFSSPIQRPNEHPGAGTADVYPQDAGRRKAMKSVDDANPTRFDSWGQILTRPPTHFFPSAISSWPSAISTWRIGG